VSDIFSFVMVGTNDLDKSSKFYDVILKTIKLKKIDVTERYIGYSHSDTPKNVIFYVTKPQNKQPATIGNGTMITFNLGSKEEINNFYKNALIHGAKDEGSPGLRSDGNYYAYIRDLDGNKIAVRYKT
tara:strand:- start:38 stop:421 length:384 start_codon:yes stop_codon:yes gene_type:complete